MLKKIIFSLFLICLLALFAIIVNYEVSSFKFYIISLSLMLLGFLLYPLNKKFDIKSDFLILPFIIVILFNLYNIIFNKNFNESFSLVNIVFGLFGFGQYYYKQIKNKTLYNKKQNQ